MLQENKEFIESFKAQQQKQIIKKATRTFYYKKIKRITLYSLLFVFSFLAIFYPVETGTVIGTWIHDFFGTILKNITK